MKLNTLTISIILTIAAYSQAVTSNITEFKTAADFSKGDPNGVVIDSSGKMTLNRDMRILAEEFEDVWTINTIAVIKGDTFIGTSPNGAIYKINDSGKELIYTGKIDLPQEDTVKDVSDAENDPNNNQKQTHKQTQFANEHIFALAQNSSGRLIAGISGENCRIIVFSKDFKSYETAFELKEDSFIFDIDNDDEGNLYVATGAKGNIYKISPDFSDKSLLCSLNERGITSIKVAGKTLYAGSDKRGVIYQMDTNGENLRVLYQANQTDITSLDVDSEGNVYASAAGIKMGNGGITIMPQNMSQQNQRPESTESIEGNTHPAFSSAQGGVRLTIAASKPSPKGGQSEMMARQQQSGTQGAIYKISPKGIVSTLYQTQSMPLDAVLTDNEIYIATNTNGKLISINPATRFQSEIYEDARSTQITSLQNTDGGLIVGLSNPAKLIILADKYTSSGNWVSDVIDAGQPAIWGKLQLDVHIPDGCSVMVSSRSGNLNDTQNGDFTEWSSPVEVSAATQIDCPVARFAQVKIILKGKADKSPTIRGVAIANVVPNIAPIIRGVRSMRAQNQQAPQGTVTIETAATDENNDPLVYKYEISEIDSDIWVEIEEQSKQNTYQWNTLSVPDGIYLVRVTVSDKLGNCPRTALEATHISEPIVIDNTPPTIVKKEVSTEDNTATITFVAKDEYSLISSVRYTINSSDKWVSIIPDDMLYDTMKESFTIEADNLEAGRHIVAIEISDALDNKRYESVIVEISE